MSATPTQVISVSELTRRIKALLEGQFPMLWVEGEKGRLFPRSLKAQDVASVLLNELDRKSVV